MSYILDALKKTEAERDPVAAANLALTQQRAFSPYRVAGIVVAVALLANAAVLIWLFGPTSNPPPPVASVTPATAPPVQGIQEVARVTVQTPIVAPVTVPAAPPIEVQVQPVPRISARLGDLPAPVRARFPGLVFSTHIYAIDPSLRAVVANGNRLVEGDEINGTAIERITADGVILAFENYLVEIPVVADWE